MNHTQMWEKSLKHTEVVRPRVTPLSSVEDTNLSYVFLGQSAVNAGTTVVRKGSIRVERPRIYLPPNVPHLEGFELEGERRAAEFLLIRGVEFPSLKYSHRTDHLDVMDGDVELNKSFFLNRLQREEDVESGLVIGPEDCWQYSVLIFVCMMASRSAEKDIQRILKNLLNTSNDEERT